VAESHCRIAFVLPESFVNASASAVISRTGVNGCEINAAVTIAAGKVISTSRLESHSIIACRAALKPASVQNMECVKYGRDD